MTEREAIEFIKYQICSGEYFPYICKDECLYGRDKCTYSLATEALEKQIPKKPKQDGCYDKNGVWHEWIGINGRPYELCPTCGQNLCCEMPYDTKPKYCENCGQKLDWSGENEID